MGHLVLKAKNFMYLLAAEPGPVPISSRGPGDGEIRIGLGVVVGQILCLPGAWP